MTQKPMTKAQLVSALADATGTDKASNIRFEEALSEPVASANADTSCAFVIGFCVMVFP